MDELVNINDIIAIDIMNDESPSKEMIFKLVGDNGNMFAEVPEISLNSPLGAAVFHKRLGDTSSYIVGNSSFSILIKSKLKFEQNQGVLNR